MQKITFEEAYGVMVDLQNVFEEVIKERFVSIPGGTIKFLLLSDLLANQINDCTVKGIKDFIIARHHISDKREISHLDVKISKIFRSLSELGLTELTAAEHDARVKEMRITPKGKKIIDEFKQHAKRKWEEIVNV